MNSNLNVIESLSNTKRTAVWKCERTTLETWSKTHIVWVFNCSNSTSSPFPPQFILCLSICIMYLRTYGLSNHICYRFPFIRLNVMNRANFPTFGVLTLSLARFRSLDPWILITDANEIDEERKRKNRQSAGHRSFANGKSFYLLAVLLIVIWFIDIQFACKYICLNCSTQHRTNDITYTCRMRKKNAAEQTSCAANIFFSSSALVFFPVSVVREKCFWWNLFYGQWIPIPKFFLRKGRQNASFTAHSFFFLCFNRRKKMCDCILFFLFVLEPTKKALRITASFRTFLFCTHFTFNFGFLLLLLLAAPNIIQSL